VYEVWEDTYTSGRLTGSTFLRYRYDVKPKQRGVPQGPNSKFYYDAIDGMVMNNGDILKRDDVLLSFNTHIKREWDGKLIRGGNATYLGLKNGKHLINFNIEDYEITIDNIRALVIHEIEGHGIHGYSDKTNDHYKAYMLSIDSKYWTSTTDNFRMHTAQGLWTTWVRAGNLYTTMPTKYANVINNYHPDKRK
jgi:hypothetical protein